jgi:hypothetical protein
MGYCYSQYDVNYNLIYVKSDWLTLCTKVIFAGKVTKAASFVALPFITDLHYGVLLLGMFHSKINLSIQLQKKRMPR